jgi:hypothetical protein
MKVIAYVESADGLRNAQSCLEWALSEPNLNMAGCLHQDGKTSSFQKLKSGTVVIRVHHAVPNTTKETA